MIVRILGEGQFLLSDTLLDVLNELDGPLEAAVDAGDEEAFARALTALLEVVRAEGSEVDPDLLAESDVILPGPETDVTQARAWMEGQDSPDGQGMIPG